MATPELIETFIARWEEAEAKERANYQMFLTELCDVLEVPHPDPSGSDNAFNRYVFDRSLDRIKTDGSKTTVYADLYKRGSFMLETKQGAHAKKDQANQLPLLDEPLPLPKIGHGVRETKQWDIALEKAYNQARLYIRDLPNEEGRPPFLIVCDVGYVIELYSEFTCTGGTYIRFPDPKSHRIALNDLRNSKVRDRLRAIWTDPLSLDPSKHAAKVTREVADALAHLARSLEKEQHEPEVIALFLQRILFTLFAEDVGLLPKTSFEQMLLKAKENPHGFTVLVTALWKDMASGSEYSTVLLQKVAHFNGGLFENPSALPLNAEQITLLIHASRKDWGEVEPAIFGTLLERALSPRDRHKLGAHYTPRSYVERLVKPTIIDPLRARWDSVKTAVAQFTISNQTDEAIAAVKTFHHELCSLRVLDPACGSGNFLYVTLEHMKRLEGEVLELLEQLGDTELTFEMEQFKVRPQQFYGIELNASAVAIAQLVLWIGYFQWHKKATGSADTQDRPLLPKDRTIRQQDAVLAYDEKTPRKDADGNFVTIWDGRTTKPHPVTGREVPDEDATIPLYDYSNPRRAEWPAADYIVGNPPFIGASRMRDLLGDGYTEALRSVWKKDVPESADFVMFWWEKAAELVRAGFVQRFGFITTNSIHQTFNRRVLEKHLGDSKNPLTLAYAIPDHPWVDSTDGAAVRIAMTVATNDPKPGELNRVTTETEIDNGEHQVQLDTDLGKIAANLKVGADTGSAVSLASNRGLSCPGVKLHGSGFIVTENEAKELGLGTVSGIKERIRPYLNGKDITSNSRGVRLIDLFGLKQQEVRSNYPALYQWVLERVKPERDAKAHTKDGAVYAKFWWLHGKTRKELRRSISDLTRYIATPETSKHRFFVFLDQSILPDNMLINVASDDAAILGVLASAIHITWALSTGGRLGFGNDPRYNKTRCFETFPFPDLEDDDPFKARIRELGEQLDAHRKKQQAAHPDLTLTGLYNVVEKLRREEPLNDKERVIHEHGLAAIVKQLHDEIDAAVLSAYGWDDLNTGTPLADRLARKDEQAEALEQDLLTRLVALNHERAAEEAKGKIRWLRPDYQNPTGQSSETAAQTELGVTETVTTKSVKLTWPKTLPDQVTALRALIPTIGPDPAALAAHFGKRTKKRLTEITQILETLQNLGQL